MDLAGLHRAQPDPPSAQGRRLGRPWETRALEQTHPCPLPARVPAPACQDSHPGRSAETLQARPRTPVRSVGHGDGVTPVSREISAKTDEISEFAPLLAQIDATDLARGGSLPLMPSTPCRDTRDPPRRRPEPQPSRAATGAAGEPVREAPAAVVHGVGVSGRRAGAADGHLQSPAGRLDSCRPAFGESVAPSAPATAGCDGLPLVDQHGPPLGGEGPAGRSVPLFPDPGRGNTPDPFGRRRCPGARSTGRPPSPRVLITESLTRIDVTTTAPDQPQR